MGRQITAVKWEDLEGQILPVLFLDGWDRDGNTETVTILADPEGNDPGHLDHNI